MGGSKSKPLSEQESTRVLAVFNAVDRDNNGFLNEEEVETFFWWKGTTRFGGESDKRFDIVEVLDYETLWNELDADKDKKVSKEEFAAYWEHKKYMLSGDGVVSTGDAKDFKALLSVAEALATGIQPFLEGHLESFTERTYFYSGPEEVIETYNRRVAQEIAEKEEEAEEAAEEAAIIEEAAQKEVEDAAARLERLFLQLPQNSPPFIKEAAVRWMCAERAELEKRLEQATQAWSSDTANTEQQDALAAVTQQFLKEFPEDQTEQRRRTDSQNTGHLWNMLIWGRWDSEEGKLTACCDGIDSLSEDSSMLMYAAQQAMPEAVKELLKYQADPNVTDNLGRSALMMAVTQDGPGMHRDRIAPGAPPQREVVRLLLADPRTVIDFPDVYGRTALSEAQRRDDFDSNSLEMLVQAAAHSTAVPTPVDPQKHWREVGNTIVGQKEFYDEEFARDWCRTRGQEWNGSVAQDSQPLQTVEQLLAMSTVTIDDCVTMWNRFESEYSTNTLLGLALTQPWHKSDFRICELLLRSGANPNAPDGAGRTPILQIIELAAGVSLWNDSADERRFKAGVRKRLRLLLADPRYDANPEPSESMQTPLSAARGALEADRHRDRGDSSGPSFNAEIVQMLEMAHNATTGAFVQAEGAVSEDKGQAELDQDLERVSNEMVRP